MAYTAPSGEIYLIKGVPFTHNQTHSVHFGSKSAQVSYMKSKVDVTLTDQNYVKVKSGVIRVHAQEEHLRDISYMMWKNPNIETPAGDNVIWQFAFITQISYVSNAVAEITYQIDVLQTYVIGGLVSFKQCFIERRHTDSDGVGEHLEPEPVSFSDYKLKHRLGMLADMSAFSFNTARFLVYAPFKFPYSAGQHDYQGVVSGSFQGLVCNVFNTATELVQFVSDLADDVASQIVSIVAVPQTYVSHGSDYMLANNQNYHNSQPITKYVSGAIDGHTVKNNKLFTYPYNSLLVSNADGEEITLRYEYFTTDNPRFDIYLAIQPNPQMIAIPKDYCNSDDDNYEYKVSLGNFPQLAWTGDAFRSWLANTGIQSALGTLTGGVMSEHIGGTISGALNLGLNFANAQRIPRGGHGTSQASAMFTAGGKNIWAYQQCINGNDAKRIDDFFTAYGYAINKIGTPNITNGRGLNQHYIKTVNCVVTGGCASEYMREIENIFNQGITWWRTPEVVGVYS